jgi:ubiquinone/menaquinone biosynthesis C-methylase UbiE
MATATPAALDPHVESLLACPRCHGRLAARPRGIACTTCGLRGSIEDDIVRIGAPADGSYFDDRYQVMQEGNADEGLRCLCYDQQARFIERELAPGMVVLDVGCGPALSYVPPAGSTVIGLDPSRQSLRRNRAVALRVHGTATSLPLPDHCLDAVLCLYSVHHMVGPSVRANRDIVLAAFREFARTLKQGGHLFIFEVRPWWPVWIVEQAVWTGARRLLGPRLDMHFWSASALTALARTAFPAGAAQTVTFRVHPLTTFPPVFSWPWLRVPRFLYPFDAALYHLVA